MEYIGFVFGIFGLMAYLQISSLKSRISELERELTSMKGTSYQKDRNALLEASTSYIGKKVKVALKEDHEDFDIINYGNTKHGSIVILDADSEWMKIRITDARGSKEKLIRMESIQRITADKED